jgi:hypothetical protein
MLPVKARRVSEKTVVEPVRAVAKVYVPLPRLPAADAVPLVIVQVPRVSPLAFVGEALSTGVCFPLSVRCTRPGAPQLRLSVPRSVP